MRISILEHEPDAPAGYFGDWASTRGHDARVLEVPSLELWPEPARQDLVVSLGSERSVHASPDRWITEEINFVERAIADGVPVLGICFGAQLLATALGGGARPASERNIGWHHLPTLAPELIPTGPWFRWHEDLCQLPPRAELLAGTTVEPLAFAAGNCVGLQFHPEVDAQIIMGWIDGARERLRTAQVDVESLRLEIDGCSIGARERALDLFDRIAVRLA